MARDDYSPLKGIEPRVPVFDPNVDRDVKRPVDLMLKRVVRAESEHRVRVVSWLRRV